MSIIIRYILKTIREKKLRTFLIILSISISSALFYASGTVSGHMLRLTLERMKQCVGTAEIIISTAEKSPSPYFSTDRAAKYNADTDYIIGAINRIATYKSSWDRKERINLLGMEWSDIEAMNPVALINGQSLQPFKGKKIILSQKTAQDFGLTAGQVISLEIGGSSYRFTLSGIACPNGFFLDESEARFAIVPRDILSSIANAKGYINTVYIKLKDPLGKTDLISRLQRDYRHYRVAEAFTMSEVRQQTGSISTAFMLITAIVFCMSMFVIYTSFKVITLERMPVIGTFRSIGATRRMTDMILLCESLLYGITGGTAGSLLGIAISYIVGILTAPPWAAALQRRMAINMTQLMAAFAMAVLLSVGSSFIPIFKVSKIPVKDIVLNKIEAARERKAWRLVLGTVFLFSVLVLPAVIPRSYLMLVTLFSIALSIAAMMLLISELVNASARVLQYLFALFFGNEGSLAVKNMRENSKMLNNISLLTIGIASLLLINTLSFSVINGIVNDFQDRYYEIMLTDPKADRSYESTVLSVDGVKDTHSFFEYHNVDVVGTHYRIRAVQGMDQYKTLDYRKLHYEGNIAEALAELEQGRNIILTHALKEQLGVETNDIITLKLPQGNRDYKVIGYFDTLIFSGNCALVSNKYLRSDLGTPYYFRIYVKTEGDPAEVAERLRAKLSRRDTTVWLVPEMVRSSMESNGQIFSILRAFSILTLVVGVFGVVNNLLMSFIERKRQLAVLRSIGMSKVQIIKVIFIESLFGGLVSGTAGVLSGVLLISIVPNVMKALNLPIPIDYRPDTLYLALLSGILIMVLASVAPAASSSRLSIIESIKYE